MTVGTDSGSRLAEWLSPFRNLFTRPTWQRVLVLIEGAVLTPHRRTVSAALRAAGKDEQADFARYMRCSIAVAGRRWRPPVSCLSC